MHPDTDCVFLLLIDEHFERFLQKYSLLVALVGISMMMMLMPALLTQAQDYDDDGYGGQGGQGDNDNYGNNGNNQGGYDDGYNANPPQYQGQNVDSDSSNNNPSGYSSSSPQGNGGSDADGDYEGDDNSAAASINTATYARVKRSVLPTDGLEAMESAKVRVKRHSKYIGPVYTYVKTDKHANFKWGVSTYCC